MPSYLLKSRHGIWYFRVRHPISRDLPRGARQPLFPDQVRRGREIRLSLRTKNKTTARILALKRWVSMHDPSAYPQPYEVEADIETEKYKLGKALIQKHGGLDPSNRFALEELGEILPPSHLEAYIFSWQFDAKLAAQKRAAQES